MDEQITSESSTSGYIAPDYSTIFDSLNIGVFVYRTNKKDMQFLKVNEFGCELFNFPDQEAFISHDWTLPEVCHPDEVDYLVSEMAGMNEVGDLAEHEYRLNRRNGTYVWVLCHQRVLDRHGDRLTILNSCTVIDEKKWAEEASAAKSAFLSNMSHDMRTPLNAIINIAALARDSVFDAEQTLSDLSEIELAGNYLLSLVNDALDMNMIENRELQFSPSVYRWDEFTDYLDSIIAPLCREKEIRFVCEKHGAFPDLWVDKTRLNQVLFNILSNAAKYTDAGGAVMLSGTGNIVGESTLSCNLVVSDTGIGMSKGFQKRMFDPFEREERVSAYAGTGLGLSIAKEIVEAMGGTISVESQQGVGTAVSIHLDIPLAGTRTTIANQNGTDQARFQEKEGAGGEPRERATAPATPHEPAEGDNPKPFSRQKGPGSCNAGDPAPPSGGMPNSACKHLLIVEDNLSNRRILLRLIKKHGYTADCTVNGKEALEAIEACKPDTYAAVLMDIRMPVMDGLTATRRIRALPSTYAQTVPIIAMTADAYVSDEQASLSAGMNAHLTKPVDPRKLFQTLGRLTAEKD